MNVGDRIKARRKQLGMSAETLAAHIGKSAATIYRYENGDISNVSSEILLPIADALQTSPGYLMGWDEIANSLGSDSPTAQKLHAIGSELSDSLSNCESELLSIFRSLNDLGQQTLLGTARGLAANPDMKKDGALNNVTA